MRLQIDPIACDGFGYCAELAPELITLDEWGYPMVDARPLPAGSLDSVRQAVRDCPRKALQLVPTAAPSGQPRAAGAVSAPTGGSTARPAGRSRPGLAAALAVRLRGRSPAV